MECDKLNKFCETIGISNGLVVYNRLISCMYSLAMSITKDHHAAQDIVQESLLKTITKIDIFDREMNEQTLRSWMSTITVTKQKII